MKLNLIFAINKDYLFGVNNELPWLHCKDDMTHFNRITTDIFTENTLVMGRRTFESLNTKLPDRKLVVISSTLKGDNVYSNLEEFIKNYKTEGKIFIIGGKALIEEVLTKYKVIVDTIYTSIVKTELKEIDTTNRVYLSKELIEPYLVNKKEKTEVDFYCYKNEENEETQYLRLLEKCLTKGDYRKTRNANTYSYFGDNLSFDLKKGFPLLSTKKMFVKGIFEELIFFLKGQTDSKILESKGVNIWKWNTSKEFIEKCKLPYDEGDMGPMYGWQWRHYGAEYKDSKTDYSNKGYDQISEVIKLLITDPFSRRILLTDYNPAQAKSGVLYPCHSIVIQFYCREEKDKKYISMNMYQRSVDSFLGLPFNITSNALLLHLVCSTLNKITEKEYIPDKLNIIMGDIHIYEEHIDQVKEQLKRIPYDFPQIRIKKSYDNLEEYKWDDIEIINYQSHPTIKAQMIA
jgi:thymidylate synthase